MVAIAIAIAFLLLVRSIFRHVLALVRETKQDGRHSTISVHAKLNGCGVWSGQVVQTLQEALGDLSGVVIELHAGMAYLDSGLAAGLSQRGAGLEDPVKGRSFGQQLAFYKQSEH